MGVPGLTFIVYHGRYSNHNTKRGNTVKRIEWSEGAACKGMAGFDSPGSKVQVKKNLEVCLNCPVLDMCLAYSLAYPDEEGFWAGTTKKDRKEIRQNLPRQAFLSVPQEDHSTFSDVSIRNSGLQLAPVQQAPYSLDQSLLDLLT